VLATGKIIVMGLSNPVRAKGGVVKKISSFFKGNKLVKWPIYR
jgi:hypothetical protein